MAFVRDFDLDYGTAMPKIGYTNYDSMYTGLTKDPSSTLYTPVQNKSDFGWNNETLGTVFSGLNALTGLANAYMGYKAYGLAKDQFMQAHTRATPTHVCMLHAELGWLRAPRQRILIQFVRIQG